MTTTTLQQVQSTLEQRGVRDVKFFFSQEMRSMALSDASVLIAGVLNGYLNTDKDALTRLSPLNDDKIVSSK